MKRAPSNEPGADPTFTCTILPYRLFVVHHAPERHFCRVRRMVALVARRLRTDPPPAVEAVVQLGYQLTADSTA